MKHYGLIGKTLNYSFSKDYFTRKFAQNNIDADYKNYEYDSIETLRSSLGEFKELSGLNVTIPYKQLIIPILDEIDEAAKAIGAVNTIAIRDGIWKGYNSDYYGFMTSLKPFLENKHDRALILGSGGASLAIQYALKLMQIPYHIVSREKGSGDLTYEDLNMHVINACKLIINTTPIGTFPTVDECPPLPYEFVGQDHFLYDLVYNPQKTKFLSLGEEQGAMLMNGLDMLKHQAEKSWQIWNELD